MKKMSYILIILGLMGCQATSTKVEPVFTSDVIEITEKNLPNYWVLKNTKVKMLNKRPAWLSKGRGEWTVLTVIDSNGYVVEKTLISSTPEGFMTQSQVDEMPKSEFKPSEANKNTTPVKFYSTGKVVRRSEL
ncbi:MULTISPECIES: hypothetical protein [Pseudomonadati]|uniref:TonB C-terminal domain-containing protein n=1 Tax=Shewanella aestuarii TaxID=1028752 RepID=A0ABT0L3B9_9GAMM|nr:hypothetical protein [Shewanella aestuarii]MCL1118203.1 hypothetical protein [Shewanella aestuarii]GGN81326.1 hypothetical protein GCM10009193_27410 [Shewanella aestuarii]